MHIEIAPFVEQNSTMFIVVCIMMGLDIVSGLVKAFKNHEVSSTRMREGLFGKCGMLIALFAIAVLQIATSDPNVHFPIEFPLFNTIAGLMCAYEAVSIIENGCAVSNKVKSAFGKWLKQVDMSTDED